MSLREERNEQNEQKWRAHFEQERLDLSASVEAALMDDGVLIRPWEDGFYGQDNAQSVTGGTELIPPRLSLQSKMLPAVQPERFMPTATDTYQTISSPDEEEEQSSGMLARLARRFTSSFAVVKPEMPQQQAPYPLPINRQLSAPTTRSNEPMVRVIDTVLPSNPVEGRQQAEPKKPRSLKRNGKVRLETTEQPAIAKAMLPPPQLREQETGEAFLADVRNALNWPQATPMSLARGEKQNKTPNSTHYSTTQAPFYGSGTFESEQSESMITNPHITARSVVLVTLTTNPGPVVVQYISLQPQVGFTVHLTAPTTTRTTFNYAILLGEMA